MFGSSTTETRSSRRNVLEESVLRELRVSVVDEHHPYWATTLMHIAFSKVRRISDEYKIQEEWTDFEIEMSLKEAIVACNQLNELRFDRHIFTYSSKL